MSKKSVELNKREFTVFIENGMRVKHNAKARLLVKSGREVLQDDFVDAESLGGAFTVASFVYNRASMSGGVDWWNPATGQRIERPKITVYFRPQDILRGDEECDCERCLA